MLLADNFRTTPEREGHNKLKKKTIIKEERKCKPVVVICLGAGDRA